MPSLLAAWRASAANKLLEETRAGRVVPDQTCVIDALRDLLRGLLGEFKAQAGCFVFYTDDLEGYDAAVSVGYSDSDELFAWRASPTQGIVARAAARSVLDQRNVVDLASEVSADPDYVPRHPATRAQMTIALLESGRHLAVVALESVAPIPPIYKDIAERENEQFALRLAQLRRAVASAQLERTFELLNEIGETDDDEKCWGLVMNAAISFVDPLSEVSILRRDGGELVHVAWRNVPAPPAHLRIGIEKGRGYTCFVGRTRRPFYCSDVRNSERYPEYLPVVKETSSQYTIPLVFRADLVGVLNVGSPTVYGFPKSVRHILDLIASHAANTLHYTSLVSQLRTATHRVKNHLRLFSWVAPSLQSKLAPEVASEFEPLFDAVERASSLVEEIVYPLRPVDATCVDVLPLLREVVREFQSLADEAHVTIEHDLDSAKSVSLKIDPDDFSEVVRNVLWNAFEALESSEFRVVGIVHEQLAMPEHRVAHLLVSIRDTGRGFAGNLSDQPIDLKAVKSTKLRAKWRGMGLWICDRILANYGGYISLEAAQPSGTIARLYLPLAEASDAERA